MVGRGIALLFHDRDTSRRWVVSSTPRPHFTPEKDPVPTLQEAAWAPGSVWTGGKTHPHLDSIPECPARSQSLYRLSYPAHIRALIAIEYRPSGSIDCTSCMDEMIFVCSDLGDNTVLRLGRSFISHWKDWKGNCLARNICCHGQWKLKTSFNQSPKTLGILVMCSALAVMQN
jgi:hypothetical protein